MPKANFAPDKKIRASRGFEARSALAGLGPVAHFRVGVLDGAHLYPIGAPRPRCHPGICCDSIDKMNPDAGSGLGCRP